MNRYKAFHTVSIEYHKTAKIIGGLSTKCTWDSNNLACERAEVNLFRH